MRFLIRPEGKPIIDYIIVLTKNEVKGSKEMSKNCANFNLNSKKSTKKSPDRSRCAL